MVGKVTVRSQGPVRRKQTTTTFKKGGKVSSRTRHIENEKEEVKRVDRNIRRNEGYKKGGRVKKASGGMSDQSKYVRKTIGDVKDATKKMSPHQDPKSKNSASLRSMLDNAKKKKMSPNPHVDSKKRMGPAGSMKKGMPKMGSKGAKKKKN